MAKPERWRLDRASYPFGVAIQTRFGDVDLLGHLNNVSYATFFENGRGRFNHQIGENFLKEKGDRWLVAAVEIAYLAEGFHPDEVDVAAGVGHVGTSSWVIEQAVFQKGKCIATCNSTLVYQGGDRKAKPLSEGFRADLARHRTKGA